MRTFAVRVTGFLLTLVALAVFAIVHATILPQKVSAAPCCEDCELELASCYAGCSGVADVPQCDSDCDSEYEGTGRCLSVCVTCSREMPPDMASCFECIHEIDYTQGMTCEGNTQEHCVQVSSSQIDYWSCWATGSEYCG